LLTQPAKKRRRRRRRRRKEGMVFKKKYPTATTITNSIKSIARLTHT